MFDRGGGEPDCAPVVGGEPLVTAGREEQKRLAEGVELELSGGAVTDHHLTAGIPGQIKIGLGRHRCAACGVHRLELGAVV